MDETGAYYTEKHQYRILTHIYGIRKMVTITLYARQQKRHRCIEQSFGLKLGHHQNSLEELSKQLGG